MKNKIQHIKNTLSAEKNQQLVLPIGVAFLISQDAPVRKLWEVLEEIDFTPFEKEICPTGRKKAASVQELTAVVIFGAMNGIYSSRKLESSCNNDIRYMWLLDGRKSPDHSVISRFCKEVLPFVLEQIFPQLMTHLHRLGEIDYETVFIDGTKLEANANKYSFVWKKSKEKHLAKLKEKADILVKRLGVDEKLTKELLCRLAAGQREAMTALGLEAVYGSGKRKSEQQKLAEELETLANKWEEYDRHLAIIGEKRNSDSKTDHDATFMHMKDDHMKNSQLKPGYNVQLAVNSEYIVGYDAFSDRNDSGTLIPFMETLSKMHRGHKFKSVTADAGYESHENYTHLEENEQMSFIKPSNYERSKKKSNWVGNAQSMEYDPDKNCFTCKAGKLLLHSGKKTRKSATGYESVADLYTCTECFGCKLRSNCSRAQQENTKTLEICWEFNTLRKKSLENIVSNQGILYRVNRSIQVEGAFGVIKQDYGFRRFLTRGKRNILTEIAVIAFAFNINKLHAKTQNNRRGTQLFQVDIA